MTKAITALLPFLVWCVSRLDADLTTITVPGDLDGKIRNVTLRTTRVILGQSEVEDFEAIFDLRAGCESLTPDGSSWRPALLVLFRRFHIPAYGDACPSVALRIEAASGARGPLEVFGSCISAMTDLQWYLMDGVYASLRITGLQPGDENQPGTLDFMLIPALFPHGTARCPEETLDCLNMTFHSHQRVCIRPFEEAAEFGTCVEPKARKGVHTPLSRANLTIYLVSVAGAVAVLLLAGTLCVCLHKRRTRHRIAKKRNGRVLPERLGSANEQREFQYTRVHEQTADAERPQPEKA